MPAPTQQPSPVQNERELEVARLKEERHQAREMKRKEEYVKQCRLIIEERRLKVYLKGRSRCSSPCYGPLHGLN